jgi:hypothetical protein
MLSYEKLRCKIFSALSLGYFSRKLALNDENRVCFKHDISAIDMTYQGKWSSPILRDYCLTVTGDSPGLSYIQTTSKGVAQLN